MKIYRFRQLINEIDYCRLRNILETENFWCSNFWDLNDPMEGVFSFYGESDEIIKDGIKDIYHEKNKYKICSFSGKEGFRKPIMWGYYTDGFKGVAIEVEVKEGEVKEVKYKENIVDVFPNNDRGYDDVIKEIFTRKLKPWEHENEYRFLKESEDNNYHKIGEITAVYFGNPYGGLENSDDILKDAIQKNGKLAKYNELKNRLKNVAKEKNIHYYNVKSKNRIEIVKDFI